MFPYASVRGQVSLMRYSCPAMNKTLTGPQDGMVDCWHLRRYLQKTVRDLCDVGHAKSATAKGMRLTSVIATHRLN